MKEATGELNTTVIVVISVAILSAFFFGVLWPILKGNFDRQTGCKAAICNCNEENRVVENGIEYCKCTIKKNKRIVEIKCAYKG